MNRPTVGESLRAEKLVEAQDMAAKLFDEISDRRLVRAGIGEQVWLAGREFFRSEPEITGEQLYNFVVATSRKAGWDFGGIIAGHLVGEFPHEKIDGADIESYVAPGSTRPMRRKDRAGNECHWILEVHLVDRDRGFGGFYEEMLDLP